MAANRGFVDALAAGGRRARAGLRGVAARPGVVGVAFNPARRGPTLAAGSPGAIAAAGAPLVDGGRRLGTLGLSVTSARSYAAGLRKLTGLQVGVSRAGRMLADTNTGARMVPIGGGDFEFQGEEYRGRAARLREVIGPPVVVSVYDPSDELTGSLGNSRILIGGILLSFLLLRSRPRCSWSARSRTRSAASSTRRGAWPRATSSSRSPPTAATSLRSWAASSTACPSSSRPRSTSSTPSAGSWRRPSGGWARRSPPASTPRASWS